MQAAAPAATNGADWQATALRLPAGLEFGEWEQIGGTLSTMERGVNWWVGDWLNYGERQYGEKYAAAVQETGRRRESLMNLASVAGRIPPESRRGALSWTCHRVVAYLDPAERDRLLDEAEEKGWGSRELESAVKDRKRAITPGESRSKSHRSGEIVPPPESDTSDSAGEASALTLDTAAPVAEEDTELNLVAELEHADAEIRRLEALVDSLQTTDHGKEIAKLALKYNQLDGRLRQLMTEANEAKKQAKYQGDLLRKIRGVLGVESNAAILQALMRRAA